MKIKDDVSKIIESTKSSDSKLSLAKDLLKQSEHTDDQQQKAFLEEQAKKLFKEAMILTESAEDTTRKYKKY